MIKSFIFFFFPLIVIAGSNPKSAKAVRTPSPIHVDGVLDEPEWQLTQPVSDFKQLRPIEAAEPSEKTEIRILYDDNAVYFGCTMHDSDPDGIVARLARRDDEVEADNISVRFDTFHDHQTNYEFTLNAAGVKTDILQYDDGRREDLAWDVVWDAKTRITRDGWTAEIRIPFQALRYNETQIQEWGFQIYRWISRKQERIHWALIRKSESGGTSHFGHLLGIEHIPMSGGIELLPFVLGTGKFTTVSPEYPNGKEFTFNGGGDIKYRPNSGLTIDATINPDFGQVEADPSVLNVSTFETFYPEKRPFFIEGNQIFQFNTFDEESGLFYSRRIGRSIKVDEPTNGTILDQPHYASIVGAMKISGRIANGLSIGILDAVTNKEAARFSDSLSNAYEKTVEPLTNYSLIRLRQDFWDNSQIGTIVTSVNRDDRIPTFTGGLDWNIKFLNNFFRIDGFWAASHAQPKRELLEGSAGKIAFRKEGGSHWREALSLDYTSRQFYINDMGYFRRPNDYGGNIQLQYREDVPADWYQNWQSTLNLGTRFNFDGAELYRTASLYGSITLLNYWNINGSVGIDFGKYDDRETRGNGWYRKPGGRQIELEISTDPRRNIVAKLEAGGGNDTRNATDYAIEGELQIKPVSNIALEIGLQYSETERKWAWVENIMDPVITPSVTSIFAERSTREWDITLRGSFVFTQALTLKAYVQTFIAQQEFGQFAKMLSSEEFTPLSGYTKANKNELALNSNLVLRWEYLPGSTLFFVWSHVRNNENNLTDKLLSNNISDLFSTVSDNTLILKISYWIGY